MSPYLVISLLVFITEITSSFVVNGGYTSSIGASHRNNGDRQFLHNIKPSYKTTNGRQSIIFPTMWSPRPSHSSFVSRISLLSVMNMTQKQTVSTGLNPPSIPRDEYRTVLAGDTTSSAESSFPPSLLQSPSSSNRLLNPPRQIGDPYGWMRDDSRSSPRILKHLHKENAYTESVTAHLSELREQLYQEMLGTLTQTDHTVPMLRDGDANWWYYTRTYQGISYRTHCRAPTQTDTDTNRVIPASASHWDGNANTPVLPGEEVYLDQNSLAEGHAYCALHSLEIVTLPKEREHGQSADVDWMAYTVDYVGGGVYSLWIKDVATNELIHYNNRLDYCGQIQWGKPRPSFHNTTVSQHGTTVSLFFVTMDSAKRPYRVYRRRLWINSSLIHVNVNIDDKEHHNNPPNYSHVDDLIYEESDNTFTISISKTSDNKYLLISSSSKETSEVHYLDLEQEHRYDITNTGNDEKVANHYTVQCISKRKKGVLYNSVDHWNGHWVLSTNAGGTPNKRLVTVKVAESIVGVERKTSSPAKDAGSDDDIHHWNDVVGVVVSNKNNDNNDNNDNIDDKVRRNKWTVLFPGSRDDPRSLESARAFRNHIVMDGREEGMPQIWVARLSSTSFGGGVYAETFERLSFEESAYDARIGPKQNYDGDGLLVWYNSLTTPFRVLRISLEVYPHGNKSTLVDEGITNKSNNTSSLPHDIVCNAAIKATILKRTIIPGYDQSKYGYHRTTVTSRDGITRIPVSMVYRLDTMENYERDHKTIPVHLYGYGSYGACCEADFSANRLPLMDRGIVFVCAHVRGGGEMGRRWYEEPDGGKYLCKKNTFNDFCDVAMWLIQDKKMTTPQQLSCEGASAGGLLIGASINQSPELFRAAILRVPFVDVVCTMLDSSLPLTCEEWEEWGNPNEENFFDYMLEYSPMNNVKQTGIYPACLVTGGLFDPSVQYWEPTKFVAQLRHCHDKERSGPVCLKMDMSAGHFSSSDRYRYLFELAFDYAFLLDQMGLYLGNTPTNATEEK